MFIAETTAYQQLLNTTGSSFNLTALSTEDVDSDDDIENNILPRRPGPISAPKQAAAAADARTDNQEFPRQPITANVSALPNSAKNAENREKRFVLFIHRVDCVSVLAYSCRQFLVLITWRRHGAYEMKAGMVCL